MSTIATTGIDRNVIIALALWFIIKVRDVRLCIVVMAAVICGCPSLEIRMHETGSQSSAVHIAGATYST